MEEKGWKNSLEQKPFWLFLSRVATYVVTYDTDVDQFDIEEEHHLKNSDDAIIESDDDNDAGKLSIANDYTREDYDPSLMNRKGK